jgi:hypothetical protein
LAVLGVLLVLLGGTVRWMTQSPVGAAMLAIGGVCAAAGVVGALSLTNGVAAQWALAASLFAALAALGPRSMRPGSALLATGMGLGCLDRVVAGSPMWLGTLTIIVLALGIAALVNAALARRSREPSV